MTKFEDIKAGTQLTGLLPNQSVTVVNLEWHGNEVITLTYRDQSGNLSEGLVYRDQEADLNILKQGLNWSFDADGELFRLAAEAYRIRQAYLFDPYLAIHSSLVEPLPHQITAVYQSMLPKQPLRFLLADDPGAGKTVMAGLLMRELLIRAELGRCLIIAPGSLVEQWQDEMADKFKLEFEILSRDMINASRTGNPFDTKNFLIARLDMLSRNVELQEKLLATKDFDLIVVDEAHKMSASIFGGEVKTTKRYKLGQVVGSHTRHFLLMSATPHNGKEEDFQLFLALLDADRFEGKFRDGVHKVDPSDIMRRMIKEELVRFDGTPLFPERKSYSVKYQLSDSEAGLYRAVTKYVQDEMNKADRHVEDEYGKKRRINVGFALQILQRRLASSPAAIHQSLINRKNRLERRLREEMLQARGEKILDQWDLEIDQSILDDEDEFLPDEIEEIEELIVDSASAARTIDELKDEIKILESLISRSGRVKASGEDTKWNELDMLLDSPQIRTEEGQIRKMIIFTEFRDTLEYLRERISNRIGRPEAVVVVHGGVGRDRRRALLESFKNDKDIVVLLANDAVGEGVNLQRANLMINYDLPWNPNRLEQRFGRIHRIGQVEVCHLWNLIAADTREGDVYARLLEKLEIARKALGGRVYDVLGEMFQEKRLKDLLMDAIRYGEREDVKARLFEKIDEAVDQTKLQDLLEANALAKEVMDASKLQKVREDMERAQAKKLQPHFIGSFFQDAFKRLGGSIKNREKDRYEITRVPGTIQDRDRLIGTGVPVSPRYERVTFEKSRVEVAPRAEFLTPGHPLLHSTIDLVLERHESNLRRGAILVNESDESESLKLLYILQTEICDGRQLQKNEKNVIHRELAFVCVDESGTLIDAGPAPYLDLRPISIEEKESIDKSIKEEWISTDFEKSIKGYAAKEILPNKVKSLKTQLDKEVSRIEEEVKRRMKSEIRWWDHRAQRLREQELAGKRNAKANSAQAQQKSQELADRLQRRLEELAKQRKVLPQPPKIVGGAIVVPFGLIQSSSTTPPASSPFSTDPEIRKTMENLSMKAVMTAEIQMGRIPVDVSKKNLGWDIESKAADGSLVFIEVKSYWHEKKQITLSRNEILAAKNCAEAHRLAIAAIDEDGIKDLKYVTGIDYGVPAFGSTAQQLEIKQLIEIAQEPF